MERYRRGVRGKSGQAEKVPFKVKLIRQSIVGGVIVIIVFTISLLRTTTAQKLTERIGYTLSYTVDYKATVIDIAEKLKELTKGE